ncbi:MULTISPECIES: helix-turn-helix domain-containing protein [unclassified Brucella]|uniref:helix-turn-helix domain-containing protein n=1 Tax=unclassified Brucella TaxID=2632610 RepID=UPI0009729143|nr:MULTISPECIES: helix-turn-helix domain-containing protein [unclassified Brucella]APY14758.1 hypothetical protein BKD02_11220 [Brucella sp. 09RB8910]
METIGDRVKRAANTLGGLNSLAKVIGMPRRTLGDQISGKYEVKLNFIVEVARTTGFSVTWLATGEGEMFTDPSKAPAPSRVVNSKLLHKLARLAREVHKEIGSKPHGDSVTEDAADLYNDLLSLVSNIDDAEEVEASLPRLRLLFKRKLQEQSGNQEEGRSTA